MSASQYLIVMITIFVQLMVAPPEIVLIHEFRSVALRMDAVLQDAQILMIMIAEVLVEMVCVMLVKHVVLIQQNVPVQQEKNAAVLHVLPCSVMSHQLVTIKMPAPLIPVLVQVYVMPHVFILL
jgi:hypothetical protein